MRIKCPNTDVYLELPGDRTDMKFTCPACHKVHRVTISITTPGEEPPPPPPPNSMTRAQPQMPKKYATGAYKPVVDVPIDANFVLVDESYEQKRTVDLDPKRGPTKRFTVDPDLPNRKTEIFERRESDAGTRAMPKESDAPKTEPPPPAGEAASSDGGKDKVEDVEGEISEEPAGNFAGSEETAIDDPLEGDGADKRRVWEETDKDPDVPKPGTETASSGRTASGGASSRTSARARSTRTGKADPASRIRKGRLALFALLCLLILAVGLFLGWQQRRYAGSVTSMENHLAQADAAWRRSDIDAAANAARSAESELRYGKSLHTYKNIWNSLAESLGIFDPLALPTDGVEYRIGAHLKRHRELDRVRRGADPGSPTSMAEQLETGIAAAEAGGDGALADALQKSAIDAALNSLRDQTARVLPESAEYLAEEYRTSLAPVMSDEWRNAFERDLDDFAAAQRQRLIEEAKAEFNALAHDAAAGDETTLPRFIQLAQRLFDHGDPGAIKAVPEMVDEGNRPALRQLNRLSELVRQAVSYARTVYSRPESDERVLDDLQTLAKEERIPNPAMADRAVALIEAARNEADDLASLRDEVFNRVQNDMRRNRNSPGIRMAWYMLRMGFADPTLEIDPATVKYDVNRASMDFRLRGLPASILLTDADYGERVRATVNGYTFRVGWAPLFHKPISWMANISEAMRKAGINPARYHDWEIVEGPEGPIAISLPVSFSGQGLASPAADAAGRRAFHNGALLPVTEIPASGDARAMVDDFRRAAQRLHDGIMADEAISQSLRHALKPILMGTYQKPDPRDYFDSAFCRRLVEADYLETYISPMPPDRRRELDAYRAALGKLEAGHDEFAIELDNEERMVAVRRMDADFGGDGRASDQDPETGESMPRYTWRVEKPGATVFFSPMPSRFSYAFMLADHYSGRHRTPPPGQPDLTEVWHATRGRIARYAKGAARAEGDAERWNAAIAEDSSGRFDPTGGEPGWSFPMHVLVRDDQGDPILLATGSGLVRSPDFSGYLDPEKRRDAEDAWLDDTAATFATPGELGLIFHQFFRYCSDSPLPELPNLIGSHYGLSDTHQTVYESLERRWVGRLIGDCDDLAEFFQVLTRRQGKLSHVMQLPGHAACGYVERNEDGGYGFIVLQTGPVMRFDAPTLNQVVELAYRAFDRGEGISHMTTDAVPLLLRFADEETRTPFVLSARIYEDAEYAETMIRVQAFWHEHVYSAALKIMEEMVREDQEIGNIKELGSLYERVGMYDKSEELRRRELDMVKDNHQAALSTLLEIAQLHFQDKDDKKALEALGEMEARMLDMIRRDDAPEFFRAMTFRSFWAMYMARLNHPARAWNLIRYDVNMTKRQLGQIADPVLRTLVVMYDRMCMKRDAGGEIRLTANDRRAMAEMRRELEEAFGRGYFRPDDPYNAIIGRYFVMGRYAVSDAGRDAGLERLLQDGPYPDEPRDQTRRNRGVDDEDWKWLRITPQLYLALGTEMLDRDEYPELYNPDEARPILESVARAVARGTGLGSDVAGGDDGIKAEMTLSFINRDLAAFRRCMTVVKEKDYASLYDDAAMTFGLQCNLIPLSEFPDWVEAFHQFFPGSQHYFKVVYRALDKENYDHALLMAEATARFFPDKPLLRDEALFVRNIVPALKLRKMEREAQKATESPPESTIHIRPAA